MVFALSSGTGLDQAVVKTHEALQAQLEYELAASMVIFINTHSARLGPNVMTENWRTYCPNLQNQGVTGMLVKILQTNHNEPQVWEHNKINLCHHHYPEQLHS